MLRADGSSYVELQLLRPPCPSVGSERRFGVQRTHRSMFGLEAGLTETSAHLSRDSLPCSLSCSWTKKKGRVCGGQGLPCVSKIPAAVSPCLPA